MELTRALTTLENARMEWNSARLKFPVLSGSAQDGSATAPATDPSAGSLFGPKSFGELCRIGLGLTWPVGAVGILILVVLVLMLVRR